MRLGVGTVQFGLPYGVSNRGGQTPEAEVRAILGLAEESGIDLLDTAPSYGTSEAVLGRLLRTPGRFRIVTKTPPLDSCRTPGEAVERVRKAFAESLQNLGHQTLYAVLVHHAGDLCGPEGDAIMDALTGFKAAGQVEKVGVSVYVAPYLQSLLSRYQFDVVQVPLNVLDQRLLRDGTLARLKARGVEVHARSLFLQGLLLMPVDQVPEGLRSARPALQRFRAAIERDGVDPVAACLHFVGSVPEVDVGIVGVNDARHFREILAAWRSAAPRLDRGDLAVDDPGIVDPSQWNQGERMKQ